MDKTDNNNFLQSDIWRQFQEAVGHKIFNVKEGSFSASIIEHKLPIVGKYFYCPRGPIIGISNDQIPISNQIPNLKSQINLLVELAKKENVGWIRIDLENNQALELIKNNVSLPIKKASHDMQPKEIFVIDITKSEEELLSEMKSKTRYNINLAQKKGVLARAISNDKFLPPQRDPAKAVAISNQIQNPCLAGRQANDKNKEYYVDKFIELVNLTAKRKGVEFHPGNYYQKMIEIIPGDILKLYIAEYNNKVIAANLMIFATDTAIYLHGATDDEYRNVMAPYLLQWQAIKDAKSLGYKKYDFGGIKSHIIEHETRNNWQGITKFKLGFSPATQPMSFPGSFDLIIDTKRYFLYRMISRLRNIAGLFGN